MYFFIFYFLMCTFIRSSFCSREKKKKNKYSVEQCECLYAFAQTIVIKM